MLITMDERKDDGAGGWVWVNDPETTASREDWVEANADDQEVAEAIEQLEAGVDEVWLGGGAQPLTRIRVADEDVDHAVAVAASHPTAGEILALALAGSMY